jgi:hypothetical protein
MSHAEIENQQQDEVDFVADSDREDEVPEPEISCKHCIHKDVCYFLTNLDQTRQSFKCSGVCTLPYDINILATTCKKYETTKPLAESILRDDTAESPEEDENPLTG